MTDDQPELISGLAPAGPATSPSGSPDERSKRRKPKPPVDIAEVDPVAHVLVDLPLAHLDRPFDYAVPATMADGVRPGVRVKVRFAGQDVDAYVVGRAATSDHTGRLTPIRRLVSPEPVLAPQVARLTEAVAHRYAGTRSDVLRLAVPPRHATTEKQPSTPAPPPSYDATAASQAWAGHEPAAAFLAHLAGSGSPRAVWTAAPGADWPGLLAHAASAAVHAGRGALLVVPDHRDVDRLGAALHRVLGEGGHVALTADSGPSRRYRDFLAVARGAQKVVVGTRSAAFAPVHDLGLVAIWDDGDDLHAEPRAPYPHAREVLLLRAEQQGAAALVGGFARTVEAAYLLASGWAHEIAPPRDLVRERIHVAVTGATDRALERDPAARAARMPREVHDTIRAALELGPVLVQTPRHGYAASLACERCRTPARCAACRGPLRLPGPAAPPTCGWCGTPAPGWSCGACGHRGLRAPVVGDERTAEELGRAFPGTRVRVSAGDTVLAEVPDHPDIVVATPGAEPVAPYAAVVLLDTWLPLGRAGLRAEEEALRRWLGAAALARPGGRVLAVGDPAHPALQALVRWDPAGFAEREMSERQSAHLPPASRLATISGEADAVEQAAAALTLPPGAERLGPVPVADDEVRLVVRVPRAHGAALSVALGDLQRTRSARKLPAVRVQVDPVDLQ